MKRLMTGILASGLAVSLALLPAGCPTTGDTGNNNGTGNNNNSLSGSEELAVSAGLNAITSLVNATNTTQSATGQDSQSALDTPGQVTFGACPAVTLTPSNGSEGSPAFALNLDFGTGCFPGEQAGQDDLFVAGSVTGTFNQSTKNITAQFDSLSINDDTLDGTCDVVYGITSTNVSLDGDWNLTYQSGGDNYSTSGEGTGTFNRSSESTTISSFDGSIEDGVETYNVEVSNAVTAFTTNGNFIPQSGTLTLSGSSIRTTVIRFNSESPTTGTVEVSVDGSPFFEWQLNVN